MSENNFQKNNPHLEKISSMGNIINGERSFFNKDLMPSGLRNTKVYRENMSSEDISLQEMRKFFKKVMRRTPEEMYKKAFGEKKPSEIAINEITEALYLPQKLHFDYEKNFEVPLEELEPTTGDLVLISLIYSLGMSDKYENNEYMMLQLRMIMKECEQFIQYFPPSNRTLFKAIKHDDFGTYYGKRIVKLYPELVDQLKRDYPYRLEEKVIEEKTRKIFNYSNINMTKEFISETDIRQAFDTIVNENTQYRIAEKGKDQTTEEDRREIFGEEFRKTVFQNASIDEQKMLLSLIYRYLCAMTIKHGQTFYDGTLLNEIDMLKDLLDLIDDKEEIDLELSEDDFEEDLQKIILEGLSIKISKLNKQQIMDMMLKLQNKYLENMKEQFLQTPQILQETNTNVLEKIDFSNDDIVRFVQTFDQSTIAFIKQKCKNWNARTSKMVNNLKDLSKHQIETLLKCGALSIKDLVTQYMEGKISPERIDAIQEVPQEDLPPIDYWKLISKYKEIDKIQDEKKKQLAREKLRRKINIYRLSLGADFEKTIDEKSYELVLNNSEEYEENKAKGKENGFSGRMVKELYLLGLVSLESIASLDAELLKELQNSELPEDKQVSLVQIIQLYENGIISAMSIREYFLDGILPLHYVKNIEELNLTHEEAKKLLQEGKLNPKNILELYEKKVIKLQDLQEIVRNLPTEEDKYMYIYGNFADDGYEKIFDRLVDNISAEVEPRVSTGTGTSHEILNLQPQVEKIAMPSKLRWKFLASLDTNFSVECFPDGHVIYTFPTYEKVIVEKMRDISGGEKKDSYGKRTFMMTTGECNKYRSNFIVQRSPDLDDAIINRPELVQLYSSKLINGVSHYPETWGEKIVEYIYGHPIQQIGNLDKKFEIEFILEELRDEIESIKGKE